MTRTAQTALGAMEAPLSRVQRLADAVRMMGVAIEQEDEQHGLALYEVARCVTEAAREVEERWKEAQRALASGQP